MALASFTSHQAHSIKVTDATDFEMVMELNYVHLARLTQEAGNLIRRKVKV